MHAATDDHDDTQRPEPIGSWTFTEISKDIDEIESLACRLAIARGKRHEEKDIEVVMLRNYILGNNDVFDIRERAQSEINQRQMEAMRCERQNTDR